MKLRNKLLVALAPAATIATITPIALTSCGNPESTTYITYSGVKTCETASDTWTLEFTLVNALETNQTLKVSYAKAHHMGLCSCSTPSGTKVTVTVTRGSEATVADPATFDLCFKCYTSPSTVVTTWEQTISDFTFKKPA